MEAGYCIQWAHATLDRLAEEGIRATLQAGTMMWPIVDSEQDDGIRMSHFSYKWEWDSIVTRYRMAIDVLPEIHAWCGIVETREIIDLTTGFFPQLCAKTSGLEWIGVKPPAYLWARIDMLPPRVYYIPDARATQLARLFYLRSK